MTRGIVNAKVVLLCFSQAYKSSYYCKQEALYANKKGKLVVPVRVQDKYNPQNDWLDFIVGDNLIIDLSTNELFKLNMPKVCTMRGHTLPPPTRPHSPQNALSD